MAEQIPLFDPQSAREFLFAPSSDEDKYRRGVVGVVAGSDTYPGAGLLATLAASNTGVGMVRLNSTRRVEDLVLHYAPGVVTVGGRIQSGVIGPGCTNERYEDYRELAQFCVDSKLPLVIDAGALDLVKGLRDYADAHSRSLSRTILTPHHGEAARLLTQFGQGTCLAHGRHYPSEELDYFVLVSPSRPGESNARNLLDSSRNPLGWGRR